MSKRGLINAKANRQLKKLFTNLGVCWCESCGSTSNPLSYSHRHPRRWYYDKPDETLWDHNQVILCCLPCHQDHEGNREKTEELFERLRP